MKISIVQKLKFNPSDFQISATLTHEMLVFHDNKFIYI